MLIRIAKPLSPGAWGRRVVRASFFEFNPFNNRYRGAEGLRRGAMVALVLCVSSLRDWTELEP